MPAKSQAQRRYLNARFGHAWVKKHGFANEGKLPAHVGMALPKKTKVDKLTTGDTTDKKKKHRYASANHAEIAARALGKV